MGENPKSAWVYLSALFKFSFKYNSPRFFYDNTRNFTWRVKEYVEKFYVGSQKNKCEAN